MSDQLTTIPLSELSEIKELLRKDFPCNIFGYGLITTAMEWCTKEITIEPDEFQVLTLNGGCKEDVLLVQFAHGQLFICCLNGNLDLLRRALILWDWKRKWIVVMQSGEPEIMAILKDLGVVAGKTSPYDIYYYPVDAVLQLKYTVPEDIEMRSLEPDHATIIDAAWKYRYPGSESTFRRMIQLNDSMGAFDKESGRLIGWCLIGSSREILSLRVLHKEGKHHGLGKQILIKLAHDRAVQGKWALGFINPENKTPQNIGMSLGHPKVGDLHYITTTPISLVSNL